MEATKRLDHLDLLRGFAIIFVVGIHASGYTVSDEELSGFPALAFVRQHLGVAVPIFLLVDGFLMSRAQNRTLPPGFSEIVRKGARRLLVPWLIFNIIYVGLRAFFELRGMFPKHMVIGVSPRELAGNIWGSLIAMQLYFLPMLFLIRMTVVPLRSLWRGPIWGLIAACAGAIALAQWMLLQDYLGSDPVSAAIVGFPYFLFGAILSKLETSTDGRVWLILGGLSLLAIIQEFVPGSPLNATATWEVAKYGYLGLLYLAARRVGRLPLLDWLGQHTMEIYLIHAPVLMKVVQMVVAKVVASPYPRFAGIWVLSLAATILVILVLNRIPASRKLFGEA